MIIIPSELEKTTNKCCQTDCGNTATYYVFWPGDSKREMCMECRLQALNIARAMGFYLHTEKIKDV